MVNGFEVLTIFTKCSILNTWQCSKYACEEFSEILQAPVIFWKYFLFHNVFWPKNSRWFDSFLLAEWALKVKRGMSKGICEWLHVNLLILAKYFFLVFIKNELACYFLCNDGTEHKRFFQLVNSDYNFKLFKY